MCCLLKFLDVLFRYVFICIFLNFGFYEFFYIVIKKNFKVLNVFEVLVKLKLFLLELKFKIL